MARITDYEAGGLNVLAFLDMLAWAEGTRTVQGSDEGYDVLVGGSLFDDYGDHPRRRMWLPRYRIHSTAAGRYQLLARYWDAYRHSLGLKDGFHPKNQDRVALQQIRECKAFRDIQAGRIAQAVQRCRNIWASLPGAGYGQREHSLADLLAVYRECGGRLALQGSESEQERQG